MEKICSDSALLVLVVCSLFIFLTGVVIAWMSFRMAGLPYVKLMKRKMDVTKQKDTLEAKLFCAMLAMDNERFRRYKKLLKYYYPLYYERDMLMSSLDKKGEVE